MKAQSIYLFSILVWCTLAGPVKQPGKKLRTKFIPKSSCGEAVCNNTVTYPDNLIQKLVRKRKYLKLFSKVALIEPAANQMLPTLRGPEPNNLCRTKTITIFPKVAFDVASNQWRYIVNIKDFEQTLVYETCVDEGKTCIDKEILPYDFHTFCKQKYNVVRLVSVTNNGKLEYGKFQVPSTCVCSCYTDISNSLR